ncbi:MAG: carboxy terminal-processing peptidase [Ginsengibacter sp.]
MSKKFIPILFLFIAGGLFLAYTTMGRGDKRIDDPRSKYEKILRNVGIILEEGHYSPKKIDDAFSKEVFKKYLEDIDPDKSIFLQKDIDGFKKFETTIDDEIHGSNLESFYVISSIYTTRLDEVSKIYKDILAKHFDFTKDENIVLDGEKRNYPASEPQRTDFTRKRIKYIVLGRYADMIDDREKNAGKANFIVKPDSVLEQEARKQVVKQMDRYFSTLKNHNKPDDMFSDFVNAITSSMDPHTTYFAPVDKRSFDELLSGRFYGIGAQLKEDDGKIKVANLVAGGPAWKSGNIHVEDEIVKIGQANGEPVDVTGYAISDAVKLIRGAAKNSEVKLTIKKADGVVTVVSLLRDIISLEETFAKSAIINGNHKVGYIYLPEFYADFEHPDGRRCAVDVAKEIEKLKAQNIEGIVIDLRGNGGGSLYDVVDMAGLFIEDGPICQVRGRDEKSNILKDRDRNILYAGPLAVMVDEQSASASEIFAAAIQDYNRGIIIGSSSTYGKGTVQRSISLDPEAENSLLNKSPDGLGDIKLTFRKFYRINGGATQLKGVTPDIIIPDKYEYLKIREKDNPDALSWDEITQAPYTAWKPGYDLQNVISSANDQLNKSAVFKSLREGIKWLDQNIDKEYSLNLNKFRTEQKKVRTTFKQLDSLTKLAVDLNVTSLTADSLKITGDKDKVEKNKQWLQRVSDDIYIDEAVKVVNNMIGQIDLAKAK